MNEINVYVCGMKCLECEKELINTEGKRAKKFCNNTCRSNYWQKQNRKNKPKPKVEFTPVTKESFDGKNASRILGDEYGQMGKMETIDNSAQIAELEEKRNLLPKGQYYNKMYKIVTDQINKLKTQK